MVSGGSAHPHATTPYSWAPQLPLPTSSWLLSDSCVAFGCLGLLDGFYTGGATRILEVALADLGLPILLPTNVRPELSFFRVSYWKANEGATLRGGRIEGVVGPFCWYLMDQDVRLGPKQKDPTFRYQGSRQLGFQTQHPCVCLCFHVDITLRVHIPK